jgi:hypothetical protein
MIPICIYILMILCGGFENGFGKGGGGIYMIVKGWVKNTLKPHKITSINYHQLKPQQQYHLVYL